jgi:hypothetical protein
MRVGAPDWYMATNGSTTAIIEVGGGIVGALIGWLPAPTRTIDGATHRFL